MADHLVANMEVPAQAPVRKLKPVDPAAVAEVDKINAQCHSCPHAEAFVVCVTCIYEERRQQLITAAARMQLGVRA